jgi:gamma-glutamyltranspeptidase/glutathione hydrolase
MLRAGGSAADAAVAASAVLAVTSQHLCGMGGDLFALVHHGDGESPATLNASGRAGSGADADRMRREGHALMPFREDIRSVTVPGCVDGWVALHDRFGRLPLGDVLAPAIGYARDGFPASPTLVAAFPRVADLPGSSDYTDAGPIRVGRAIRRPGVARTLQAIASDGRDGFYQGDFGTGLLALGGSEYAPEDLARPLADWVDPLVVRAWGHDVWTVPPNSQGYLTLAGAWMADGLDLPAEPSESRWAHLLVEVAKQAGYDRPAVLHEGADGPALLASERLDRRRAAVGETAARIGAPVSAGDTIYLCAADGDGGGVSLIQSNASGWGSHLIEPATRIFLHNRGVGFSVEAGHPAEYGPGRRPPHTLSPALVTRPDGSLRAVIGTMGGDAQPQVLLQLLARLLHSGQAPGDALAAGRWRLGVEGSTGFDTWTRPEALRVEIEGHAVGWDDDLRSRGHAVHRTSPHDSAFGHAHVIVRDDEGMLHGAADHRSQGGAAHGW